MVGEELSIALLLQHELRQALDRLIATSPDAGRITAELEDRLRRLNELKR